MTWAAPMGELSGSPAAFAPPPTARSPCWQVAVATPGAAELKFVGEPWRITTLVAPAAPVGPVLPVAPVAPASPVGPVAPVAPATPVGPVAPTAPVAPTWPAAPA